MNQKTPDFIRRGFKITKGVSTMEFDVRINTADQTATAKVESYSAEVHKALMELSATLGELSLWVEIGSHKYSWGNFLFYLNELFEDNPRLLYFIQQFIEDIEPIEDFAGDRDIRQL